MLRLCTAARSLCSASVQRGRPLVRDCLQRILCFPRSCNVHTTVNDSAHLAPSCFYNRVSAFTSQEPLSQQANISSPYTPHNTQRFFKTRCVRGVYVSSELEEQLSRCCVGRFGWNLHGKTARSALYLTVSYREGGAGRSHVRARCVPPLKIKIRVSLFRSDPSYALP